MNALRRIAAPLLCLCAAGFASQALAAPVTYTLQTVGDGSIGSHSFSEALVTITLTSDTGHVSTQGTLSTNARGTAHITIHDKGTVIKARFAAKQVFVFYDSARAIAGFGSAVSPTYPFALSCNNGPDQATYTKDCADGSHDGYDGTLGDGTYTQSLTVTSVMTGTVHSCAGLYAYNGYDNLQLGSCPGKATTGLQTDHGMLYLSDTVGGTTGGYGPFSWGGWDTSNKGFLRVEVTP